MLFRVGFAVVGGLMGFLFGLNLVSKLISWASYMETFRCSTRSQRFSGS